MAGRSIGSVFMGLKSSVFGPRLTCCTLVLSVVTCCSFCASKLFYVVHRCTYTMHHVRTLVNTFLYMAKTERIVLRASSDDKSRVVSYAKKNAMGLSEYVLRCALEGLIFREVRELRPTAGNTLGSSSIELHLPEREAHTERRDHRRIRKQPRSA